MTIQTFKGQTPWWNDNSLSKPSQTLFNQVYANATTWTTSTAILTFLDLNRATIQLKGLMNPSQQDFYWRIEVQGQWLYFFTEGVSCDNEVDPPTTTVMLRLDKWGSCVGNMVKDFNEWDGQVKAVNKELNLYDYWSVGYYNESSYMWLKDVYPQFQKVQLTKYQGSQLLSPTQQQNTNNNGWQLGDVYYFFTKIIYLTTNFHTTNTDGTTTELHGNLKDLYTTTTPTSSNLYTESQLPHFSLVNGGYLPYVAYSPIVPMNVSGGNFNHFYVSGAPTSSGTGASLSQYEAVTGNKWTLPLLLSYSMDKDIGLIQLPFDISSVAYQSMSEAIATSNALLTQVNKYNTLVMVSSDNDWPYIFMWPTASTTSQPDMWSADSPSTYFINPNGVVIWNLDQPANSQAGYGSGWNGGWGYGWCQARANDSWIFGNLAKFGFQTVLDNISGIDNQAYLVGIPCLMCPMLFSFISESVCYMGQTITYDRTYCNDVMTLIQPYYASSPNDPPSTTVNGNTHQLKFSGNYPNLTLNWYTSDNIKGSVSQPIGQINLSTALLPNTTNPQATFETNEKKIINNSATLKNLDISKMWVSWAGGIGLNDLLNPFNLVASAINNGLNTESLNLNYSNSFGNAKQYSLAKSNTLQTAGDNLGAPDNTLQSYFMVPPVSVVQDIMGQVDKYGYLFNQYTYWQALFSNYYHNYIKTSENTDFMVYTNAYNLIKDWQDYLIQQLTNGVIIWQNFFPNTTVPNFFNARQWAQDMMSGDANFYNPKDYDTNYFMNFKYQYQTNTLINLAPAKKKTFAKYSGTATPTKWTNTNHTTSSANGTIKSSITKTKVKLNIPNLDYKDITVNGYDITVAEVHYDTNTGEYTVYAGADCLQTTVSVASFQQGYFNVDITDTALVTSDFENGDVIGFETTTNEIFGACSTTTGTFESDMSPTLSGSYEYTYLPNNALTLTGDEAVAWIKDNFDISSTSNAFVLSNEIKVGGINTHAKQQNPTNQKETPLNKVSKVKL